MAFNSQNEDELYVADSSLGLLRINVKTKSMKVVIPRNSSSVRVNFLNDIVQLPNGSFLITDSSLKFSRHDNQLDALECGANGQLIRYEPEDGSVHVVLRQLHFPNGLCLNGDRQSVMLVETTRARILRSEESPSLHENLPLPLKMYYKFSTYKFRFGLCTNYLLRHQKSGSLCKIDVLIK